MDGQSTTPQGRTVGLWTSRTLNPPLVSEVHQSMPEPPVRPHRLADTSHHRTARLQPGEGPAGSNINFIIVSGHARVSVGNLGNGMAAAERSPRRSLWEYASSACRRLAKFLANAVPLAAAAVTVWLGLR
jgi:hypothetical protein